MIGGNVSALLQTKNTSEKNAIGESVPVWETAHTLLGYVDLMAGESRYVTYSAKIQESTHIFICDYVPLPNINAENSRMVIGSDVYEISLIDNPMGMNQHLEIYLRYTGGI